MGTIIEAKGELFPKSGITSSILINRRPGSSSPIKSESQKSEKGLTPEELSDFNNQLTQEIRDRYDSTSSPEKADNEDK